MLDAESDVTHNVEQCQAIKKQCDEISRSSDWGSQTTTQLIF